MKRLIRFALILILAASSRFAFSNCVTSVASESTTTSGAPPITFNTGSTPAQMGAGTTNQKASQLLIYDDGTGCFAQGKTITVVFNAPLQNHIDASTITIFDNNFGSGLLVNPSVSQGFSAGIQTTIVTFAVLRGGSVGNPIATSSGSGIIIHDLLFDLTNTQANTAITSNVSSNGPAVTTSQPQTIGQAVGAGPVNIQPGALDFGSQITGTTSAPKTITLTNQGTLPVIVSNISASQGFNQANSCGSSIAVSGSCTISVTFSPTVASLYSGSLTITDNTTTSPHVISLSGGGVPSPGTPVITALSPAKAIAGGPDFTLTVTGSNFAPGSAIYWNGSPRSTFFVSATTLTASIPATDIVTAGTASVTVVNAATASNALPLTVVTSPAPAFPTVITIPHVIQGGGFVTKMTFVNPAIFSVTLSVTFISQTGQTISTNQYIIPSAGTLRISTPESARFGPSSTQWALVGATSSLLVNTFFELKDPTGKQVLNTVGFNSTDPLTDFSAPLEFEPAPPGAPIGRTVGMAFANPNDTSANVTARIQDRLGNSMVNYSFTLPPFGQTAFDLSQVPAIAAVLPSTNLVGTVSIQASVPIASIALVDELGEFAATPVVPGRATFSVDQITAVCPTAAEVAQFNLDFRLLFDSDPTAGTFVCRAAEGSANLTRLQLKVYQALRVMKNVAYDAPLPFTSLSLYDWFKSAVSIVRFRGDIPSSFCCDSFKSIDVAVSSTSAFIQADNWLGLAATANDSGLDTLPATLVQLARVSQGLAFSCSPTQDNTIAEMGPWAVTMDFQEYNALHAGIFFDDTTGIDPSTRYRSVALADARGYVQNGNFCHNTLVQAQPATAIDFGSIGIGDLPVRRAVVVSAGTATPIVTSGSSSVDSTDFSITSDGCNGSFQPPSCVVVVTYAPAAVGGSSGNLAIATAPLTNVAMSGVAIAPTPVPVAPYTYVIPHIIGGGGFVTKVTLSNLVSVPNDLVVRYVSQAGATISTSTYQLQAGGAVRINVIDPSARFGASTTQWAVVGSRYPINANLFFELGDSQGRVLNTIGFNASPALNSFVVPAEFEPSPDGSFGRTVGLALSNPSAAGVNYTFLLTDTNGSTLASYTGSLAGYSQTAIDLSTLAAFKAVLPKGNFVGSIRVTSNGKLAVIALQDDFGPFSATPPVTLSQ